MILQNDFLRVEISELGAEIKSIKDKDNKEWMWNGNPAFWGKTSPILFPIVGSLKNNTFFYKNNSYQLNRHGFARDMHFEFEKTSNSKAIFTLKHSKETLVNYPFLFSLKVTYELIGNNLLCSYQVENLGNETMYFSIGGHPAFALGMNNSDFESYYLEFNNDSILKPLKLNEGLISNEFEIISLENNCLNLNYDLFKNDALVFQNLKSNCITIKNKNNNSKLKMTFNDFTHFGIWTIANSNFICLEPWFGMADKFDHNQNIEEKEGMIELKNNEIFDKKWMLTID